METRQGSLRATSATPSRTGRPVALAATAYAAFILLHVVVAWDGGRVIRSVVPAIGPWLGTAGWGVYSVAALLAAALVGVRATGIASLPRRGWASASAAVIGAGLPFVLFGWNLDEASIVPVLVVGVPLVALNEELFYRGVLLSLLRPIGLRPAVTWTAVAFGASHLVNLVSGAYPPFVAMQVAATTAGGIALAAVRLRSGSLWPALLVHAVVDWIAVSTLTGSATSSPILLPVLFAWLGANLLLWRYGWRLLADEGGSPAVVAPG